MFLITTKPFHTTQLDCDFTNPQAGACATFEGRVRNHADGTSVEKLDYEAYKDLCEAEAQKILSEAHAQFKILDVRTYHRYGKLEIGDVAVWVSVLAAHREDAFAAARFLIDEYKARLPIWKKEYYTNKNIEWVNAQTPQTSFNAQEYYAKQTNLTELSNKGQEKLKAARVLLVGVGGLGASAMQGLAGAGIGTIGIVEADKLEESNLHRQNIYKHEDIGKPKIKLAHRFAQSLNPSLQFQLYPERLSAHNAEDICASFDIILDCTDNFKTKYLLNDLCVIKGKTLISASIYQWEGQLFMYRPQKRCCLRCLWPEIPPQGCVGTCTEAGVIGPVASIFGHMQALEAIKQIVQTTDAKSELIIYNLKAHHQKRLVMTHNANCPLCGDKPTMTDIHPENYEDSCEITAQDISDDQLKDYEYVDIREEFECMMQPAELACTHVPLSKWKDADFKINTDKKYIFFCAAGVRSLDLVHHLRQEGYFNTLSLNDGVGALNHRIHDQKNRESTS